MTAEINGHTVADGVYSETGDQDKPVIEHSARHLNICLTAMVINEWLTAFFPGKELRKNISLRKMVVRSRRAGECYLCGRNFAFLNWVLDGCMLGYGDGTLGMTGRETILERC